ncbi:MAG: ECF transporter S component [Candidatus Cloacimonetes bacterium]|nr:ECF transporter S component [Candidatus Cloacimonadota bacterium]
MKWYYIVSLIVIVLVATKVINIPIPGGGYFNLGDAVVVFAGLYGGRKAGLIAGGIGSALADILSGPYMIWAPITFIAKALEGWVCGFGKGQVGTIRMIYPVIGVMVMVITYFFGAMLMPQLGIGVAVADLPANIIQAVTGLLGGLALSRAMEKSGL